MCVSFLSISTRLRQRERERELCDENTRDKRATQTTQREHQRRQQKRARLCALCLCLLCLLLLLFSLWRERESFWTTTITPQRLYNETQKREKERERKKKTKINPKQFPCVYKGGWDSKEREEKSPKKMGVSTLNPSFLLSFFFFLSP